MPNVFLSSTAWFLRVALESASEDAATQRFPTPVWRTPRVTFLKKTTIGNV